MKKTLGKTLQPLTLNLHRETLARLAQVAGGVEDLTHVGYCSNRVACTN